MDHYGYAGKILFVDLSAGTVKEEPSDLSLAEKFLGGAGIGVKLLADLLKPGIDPLSPENIMVFGTGPLLGTLVPGSGKSSLSTKYAMPASRDGKKHFISNSMFGGNRFGSMMKNAGYDHVVITGRSDRPSYLLVTDKNVEIRNATGIWGKNAYEAAALLRKRHPGNTGSCGTWVIGQAGENGVRFSLGWADDWHNAGRFAGGVAGSKNLKAIVTLGKTGIKLADKKRFMETLEKKRREIIKNPAYRSTAPLGSSRAGKLLKETMKGFKACSGCISACKSVHQVREGKYKGEWFGGSFPALPSMIHMQLQLGDYFADYGDSFTILGKMNSSGLCVSTTLNMMSFVTKLCKAGKLSPDDMDGLDLNKGGPEPYLELLDMIINKRSIGALMAEGWYPFCESLGIDVSTQSDPGCPITKGVDLLVDARIWPSLAKRGTGFSPGMGLASVVHAKAKHTHSATYWSNTEISFDNVREDVKKMGMTEEEFQRIFTDDSFDTGRFEKYGGDAESAYNSLGICDTAVHWEFDPTRDMIWLSEVYSAATGLEISPREMLRAGERVFNLEKLLNVREGFGRDDDRIPPVYFQNMEKPLPSREGERYLTDWFGTRLIKKDLEEILERYYEERGWDPVKGIPTRARLNELGLSEYAHMLESA